MTIAVACMDKTKQRFYMNSPFSLELQNTMYVDRQYRTSQTNDTDIDRSQCETVIRS